VGVSTPRNKKIATGLEELARCLDEYAGRYSALSGVSEFGSYVGSRVERADEETLTEPILDAILRRVLGFPIDAYFPQLGKGGLKPDFTPDDLIAHPFVLDAKASSENLASHEFQIQRYMAQRSLQYGVLFNLREMRVFRRGIDGADPDLSFSLLPLWQTARGEALGVGPDVEAFERFRAHFSYRAMGLAEKIEHVRKQPTWSKGIASDDSLAVDVEFLVKQLRTLAGELADDVGNHAEDLDDFLAVNPGRDRKLLRELELLALDLEPGVDLASLPGDIAGWRSDPGLPARVWKQYRLRVAYLVVTRVLLYRSWEDVGFVDEYLYDGGFDQAYERLSQNLRRVLREAFLHGADRYRWLYGGDSNYEWYEPSDGVLADLLYFLAPVPLGKLDADVLGALYVSYVDEIDRDRLGQFFTPRDVVRFMLDRAGFTGPTGVFRVEGDDRRPVGVFDFATGSGGFLVEAARRVIDDGGIDLDDPRAVREALAAIVQGFVGGEISPFPYYLTEVNLLLQVSRLVGALVLAHEQPPKFVLGVVHADSLTTKSGERSIEGIEDSNRADRARLLEDDRFGLVPFDAQKRERYDTLLGDEQFDLVVGNPPYVAEANNRPLFERLRDIPAWDGIYRGKTDYLYYFLLLAAEKVAPGGRLCVITPAGWMNAGTAGFLRERLAADLRLDELFLFGSYRLFAADQGPAPTPTVESAILVATKARPRKNHKLRVVALESEADAGSPDRGALLATMTKRARGKPGRKDGIHVNDVLQSGLRADIPWPVKHSAADLGPRVVRLLEAALDDDAVPVERLAVAWRTFLGIQTGADAYSMKIHRRLSAETRKLLATQGAELGEPVYGLPPGRERQRPWVDQPGALVRSPQPEGVLYGAIDEHDYVSLVWLTKDNVPSPDVLSEIERWRPLLAERAEFKRNSRRAWWETCWPRDGEDLRAPKVIALHRTDRGRFAVDEAGVWSPSGRMSVVVGRKPDPPVAYLCGLLNSELLDIWYGIRGRVPRDVWRDYEPKPMNEMPYRRPEGDPRAGEVAELVRRITENRRALLPHRAVVLDLTRIVKDPWKDGPVEVDVGGLVAELPPAETVSVRLDPALSVTVHATPNGRPVREGPENLSLRRARQETAVLEGDPARLDVLELLLDGKAPADLDTLLLPKDLDAFERVVEKRAALVAGLLAEGRRLVEGVERLVCGLYDVPDELADEVVAHAVERASRT
jgi:hypothetical protein